MTSCVWFMSSQACAPCHAVLVRWVGLLGKLRAMQMGWCLILLQEAHGCHTVVCVGAREPQPSTGHRCLYALGTTCLLLLASSLLAFWLGRSLGGAPLRALGKHHAPPWLLQHKSNNFKWFLDRFVCFRTIGNTWDQFPTFGGRSQTKKILNAAPNLFLACGENTFPYGKRILGFYVWRFFLLLKSDFPQEKSREKNWNNFTCNRPLKKRCSHCM